jgi:AcrR family transcriptional regulator
LENEGIEAFNTNRVAERAGVSIGSLYQYFEDKEDILVAMVQRQDAGIRQAIAGQLADTQARSLRSIVHTLVYAFEGRQAIRMALLTARPNRPLSKYNQAFMDEVSKLVGSRIKLPDEAAFILTRVVVSILRQVVLENRSFALDRLEDELVCLMQSYVTALQQREQPT